jgi:hypothetical protein
MYLVSGFDTGYLTQSAAAKLPLLPLCCHCQAATAAAKL